MKTDERLSGALQENILTLLCFDKEFCKVVRASLTHRLFDSAVFREVAGIAIDFIDKFKEPVADHLPDHLEHILKGEDKRKATSYKRLLDNLYTAKDGINGEYVLSQLHKFVRGQTLKSAIKAAVEAMEDGRVDDAAVEMQKGLKAEINVFEPGTNLADPLQSLRFLDVVEKPLRTGVEALDRFDVGPARKTLMLVTGPTNKGKSWWLMQIGKYAMLQRQIVVHITLEMSEEKTTQRYLQMMFAVTKDEGGARVPRLTGNGNTVQSVDFEELDLPSLQDHDIRKVLTTQIQRRLARRAAFKVKKFPSGGLTVPMLKAYLDGLERHEGIVPDVLIIDYAELMFLGADPGQKRENIGSLYVSLRGIADERNCAVVTASQVNRTGIGKMTSDETDLSEDLSKAFTVDTMVTYNQTRLEQKMGLARLFVAKNRDGAAGMTALITQAYSMGQFCLDSVLMSSDYMDSISGRGRASADADDDDKETERSPRRRSTTANTRGRR